MAPLEAKTYLVHRGWKQWIIDVAWITEHGYRWPEDVMVISRSELNAIPNGDPIYPVVKRETEISESRKGPQSRYEGQLVRTPEDANVYVVRDGVKHWVTDSRWIIRHGFRWPGDVKVISSADLNIIPSGEPFEDK